MTEVEECYALCQLRVKIKSIINFDQLVICHVIHFMLFNKHNFERLFCWIKVTTTAGD